MSERHELFMQMLETDYDFRLGLSRLHEKVFQDEQFWRLLEREFLVKDLKNEIDRRSHTTRTAARANPSVGL
jgi:hypothetical protein